MPDRPTREYARLTALEVGGRPIEISSAEVVWIQHWNGDEPAQREWELAGRTFDPSLPDGAQPVVLVIGQRRLTGRAVLDVRRSDGYAAFEGVGLGGLSETTG
jgi:hypothetical protein